MLYVMVSWTFISFFEENDKIYIQTSSNPKLLLLTVAHCNGSRLASKRIFSDFFLSTQQYLPLVPRVLLHQSQQFP